MGKKRTYKLRSFRLGEDLEKALLRRARKGESLSDVIRRALAEFVERPDLAEMRPAHRPPADKESA